MRPTARRQIQDAYNAEHGIQPQSIQKEVHDITDGIKAIAENRGRYNVVREEMSRADMFRVVKDLENPNEGSGAGVEIREGRPVSG